MYNWPGWNLDNATGPKNDSGLRRRIHETPRIYRGSGGTCNRRFAQ